MSVGWLAVLSGGLHKNNRTHFHQTWMQYGSQPRIVPIAIWCRSRNFFHTFFSIKRCTRRFYPNFINILGNYDSISMKDSHTYSESIRKKCQRCVYCQKLNCFLFQISMALIYKFFIKSPRRQNLRACLSLSVCRKHIYRAGLTLFHCLLLTHTVLL